MRKNFVLKSVKTLKKVAAIGAGLTMLGATLTGALAAPDLKDYPAPFVSADGVYDDANAFVVGDNAAADDTLGTVDIATNLQFMAKTPVSSSGTSVSVVGGETKEIPIGFGIANTSVTNYFDADNQDDEVSSLFDGEISFKGDDYDVEEVLTFTNTATSPTNQLGPVIMTGIDDDDYKTDVFMEVAKDKVRYRYKFTESINLSQATTSDYVSINFMGKAMKITSVPTTGDRVTALTGEEFSLNEGDTVEVDGKTVKLLAVGSTRLQVEVDGDAGTVSSTSGSSQNINGIEVTVDAAIVKTNMGESSAILVLGKESSATYKAGDPYVGENKADPDWVWTCAELDQAAYTPENAWLGIENDFNWNKLGDNPPGVGECINLPNDFLSICLDSLSVADDDYMDITMEIATQEDLSDIFGDSWSSTTLLKVESSESEGFYLQQPTSGYDNYSSLTDKYVKTVYLYTNGTNFIWNGSSGSGALDMTGVNVAVDVFFEDVDDSKHLKWWGSYNGSQPILEVNYKDTKSDDIKLALVGTPNGTGACAGVDVNLTWDIQGKQTADCPDGTDDLETFWRLKANVINSLGITADTGEATDTVWGALDKTIGTKDEDLRTHYGVIIKDPDSNGDSDTVQLKIPSDQVFANVVLKGTATSVTSSGTAYVPAEVTPKTMLSSEVSDPTAYNLIIVGGPCANPLAETVFGIACADWSYAEGESLVKMVDNGEKVAMLVAGTTALDTRRACKAVGNYDEHSLTGSEVLVKGTTLSDITVESA